MSALSDALRDYLGLRRALGHKLAEHERQLTRFVARLDAAGAGFVTMAGTLAFVLDPELDPASTTPAKRLMAVRGFARWLSAIDPRTEVPPAGLVSRRPGRRVPYLFSDQDVAAVVRAARASTPSAFRAETLASLIVLLAVTGMRVGEALRLDCGDLDRDQAVIKVRDTKFGKGRDVAVSASTAEALAAYRCRRDSRKPPTTRLFVSLAGTPVIASRISGNVGMLGRGYLGYYPLADERALARQIRRVARDPRYYARLKRFVAARRALFRPSAEQEGLRRLLAGLKPRQLPRSRSSRTGAKLRR